MGDPALGAQPLGLAFLAVAVIGWGSNWPPIKLLIEDLPMASARAWPGLAGGLTLALVVRLSGERLGVPGGLWPRLCLAALLNITAWMGLSTFALLWLNASETCLVCYTMPLWAALLAWPLAGERPRPPPARRARPRHAGAAGPNRGPGGGSRPCPVGPPGVCPPGHPPPPPPGLLADGQGHLSVTADGKALAA